MSKPVPNTAETPLPAAIPPVGELGPLVGKTFGGYEVSSYIGEGPTGQVYRAEDLMGAKMAVKVMHRELSQKEHATRLWDEMKKLAASGDEHFVRVYDCGFGEDGEFFYLMDELTGVDLEAALEESGAFAPRRAIEIIDGVAAALEVAHTKGVVHGGLKPRNVFLTPTGGKLTIKVLDFGAARLAGGVDKGVIVGNPFYMAPEQFGGTRRRAHRRLLARRHDVRAVLGHAAVQRPDARPGHDAPSGRAAAAAAGRRPGPGAHHPQGAVEGAVGSFLVGGDHCATALRKWANEARTLERRGRLAGPRPRRRGPQNQASGTHHAGRDRRRFRRLTPPSLQKRRGSSSSRPAAINEVGTDP